MAVIAVAGGTGGVGKTIVGQLLLSEKHKVFILSRKVPDATSSQQPVYLQVNYSDIDSITKVLQDHNVDTVISTINMESEAASQAQLNLIQAADKSNKTSRFIPSEFGFVDDPTENTEPEGLIAFARLSAQALKSSSLEFTRFANGFFMDYWGMPHIQTDLWPYTWGIDIANKRSAIPGTGDDILSLTYSVDVAKFMVAMLDSQDWPEYSIVSGSDITFNELLAIAEKARDAKFDTKYDSLETLQQNEPTLLSTEYSGGNVASEAGAKQMVAMIGMMTIAGKLALPTENRINQRFPELHALTADELITKAWAGK